MARTDRETDALAERLKWVRMVSQAAGRGISRAVLAPPPAIEREPLSEGAQLSPLARRLSVAARMTNTEGAP